MPSVPDKNTENRQIFGEIVKLSGFLFGPSCTREDRKRRAPRQHAARFRAPRQDATVNYTGISRRAQAPQCERERSPISVLTRLDVE